MSNNVSTSFGAAPSVVSGRPTKNSKPSFWRRVFNAWLQSYSNRLDPDGNVAWEL